MNETQSACPKCQCEYTYPLDHLMVCPECGYEWNPSETAEEENLEQLIVKDAHGTRLMDGDTVTLIKDLPIRGTTKVIKIGTKVTQIKLVEGDHNIDCRIPGFGAMALKSEFVKKA